MNDPANTTPAMLRARGGHRPRRRAAVRLCGQRAGPGRRAGKHDLPGVRTTLVDRYGYHIRGYHLTRGRRMSVLWLRIPGRWNHAFAGQIASRPFIPRRRDI